MYCHLILTSGIWAHKLSVQGTYLQRYCTYRLDYQELCDRGWRRSGSYTYLLDNAHNCCPSYVIRLNALNSKLSKSHRRVRRLFDRYLAGEWAPTVHRARARDDNEMDVENDAEVPDSVCESNSALQPHLPLQKHELAVAVKPAALRDEAFALYKRYQMAVHGDKEAELTPQRYERFLCASPLVTETVRGVPMGSFHVEYRIDGKLAMVRVPLCLWWLICLIGGRD